MRRGLSLSISLVLLACSEGSARPDAALPSGPRDAAAADASADATASDAAAAADATVGSACTFNQECAAAERCACSGGACACAVGARGTVATGAAPCTSGDDCASGLCLEGPGDVLTCSGPCARSEDCPASLPRCLTVGGLAPFCARDPAALPDAGLSDGGVSGCSGACATTDVMATFGPRRGAFDRAQHGRAGADGLRLEVHFGGDPACPTESSPTPDRTLVITGLRAEAREQTYADGVRASLLDFRGELTPAPVARATAVRLTPRWLEPGVAVSWVLEATFADGSLSGGVYAPHCDSLDE